MKDVVSRWMLHASLGVVRSNSERQETRFRQRSRLRGSSLSVADQYLVTAERRYRAGILGARVLTWGSLAFDIALDNVERSGQDRPTVLAQVVRPRAAACRREFGALLELPQLLDASQIKQLRAQ